MNYFKTKDAMVSLCLCTSVYKRIQISVDDSVAGTISFSSSELCLISSGGNKKGKKSFIFVLPQFGGVLKSQFGVFPYYNTFYFQEHHSDDPLGIQNQEQGTHMGHHKYRR